LGEVTDAVNELLTKINDRLSKLFTEIAVSEEKLSNKVTETDLEKAFRAFEKEVGKDLDDLKETLESKRVKGDSDLYSHIDDKMTKVDDKMMKIDDKVNAIHLKVAKNAVIVSLVVSIITAIVVTYIKGGG